MRKTFRAVIITMVAMVFAAGLFLLNTGIVTIEERSVEHSKITIVDGKVESETRWNDIVGCDVKVDVVDGISLVWKQ